MIPQADIDNLMEHARQRAAAQRDGEPVVPAVFCDRPAPAPFANRDDSPAGGVRVVALVIVVVCSPSYCWGRWWGGKCWRGDGGERRIS